MDEGDGSYRRLLGIAVFIGVVSGFGSLLFFKELELWAEWFMGAVLTYQYPVEGSSLAQLAAWTPPEIPWLIVPVICLGGLASALLAHFSAEEIEGAVSPAYQTLHSPPRHAYSRALQNDRDHVNYHRLRGKRLAFGAVYCGRHSGLTALCGRVRQSPPGESLINSETLFTGSKNERYTN
jgi:hypothetical protein